MPSPKKPLKRELLKQELADRIQVDVSEILERREAAKFLDYKNEKTLSNQKTTAPCFYLGDLGKEGIALYSRPDLIKWRYDPEYRREMDRLGAAGRPLPWPEKQTMTDEDFRKMYRAAGYSEEVIAKMLDP